MPSRVMNLIWAYARRVSGGLIARLHPELKPLLGKGDRVAWQNVVSGQQSVQTGHNVLLCHPHRLQHCTVGDYSYLSHNSVVSHAKIGKFCSIGPNFLCGWGIHPVDGVSTSPSFYSEQPPTGVVFGSNDEIQERKKITIGNDVFIGMNVTVLDGVSIENGAVIGAGCVVTKDVPSYAIAVGNPMKILRYRFDEQTREKLLSIKWWDWPEERLSQVARFFSDVERFIAACEKEEVT